MFRRCYDLAMPPIQIVARFLAWALPVVLIIVGISFINAVSGLTWTYDGDGTYTSGQSYDLVGPGTGLLCVGLAVLAALLIIEAYRPRVSGSTTIDSAPIDSAPIDSESTHDA